MGRFGGEELAYAARVLRSRAQEWVGTDEQPAVVLAMIARTYARLLWEAQDLYPDDPGLASLRAKDVAATPEGLAEAAAILVETLTANLRSSGAREGDSDGH